MTSFETVIRVYNLSLGLIVTPVGNSPDQFKIEMIKGEPNPMILKYLPDHSWIAEKVTMRFFTKKYISELGALIEGNRPEWFLL
jgi:hypothetical protein